jgi:hypothetical protein
MIRFDQVSQHLLLREKIEHRLAPVTAIDQCLLAFEEGNSFSMRCCWLVNPIVHPAEIGIGSVRILDELPIRKAADRVICLLASGFRDGGS